MDKCAHFELYWCACVVAYRNYNSCIDLYIVECENCTMCTMLFYIVQLVCICGWLLVKRFTTLVFSNSNWNHPSKIRKLVQHSCSVDRNQIGCSIPFTGIEYQYWQTNVKRVKIGMINNCSIFFCLQVLRWMFLELNL